MRRLLTVRSIPGFGAAVIVSVLAAGCGGSSNTTTSTTGGGSSLSGSIAGSGATSQQAAQTAWIAKFGEKHSGVTISYDPVGSGAGMTQFSSGAVVYAGSDAPLVADALTASQKQCGGADKVIQAPVYVSPIAVIYNLPGVDKLQLDPNTLASIFAGKITKWNNSAIAATNPGVKLPDTAITAVHRSDKSGTSENFTDYLAAVAPSVWTYPPSTTWPISGGEAAMGTSGVVSTVKTGTGTIGYADASQAKAVSIAAIKVGSAYSLPSAEAAAKVLDDSKETHPTGTYDYTFEINHTTTTAGAYPIILVSYMLACTKYSNASTASIVSKYLAYVGSETGQMEAATAAGSAPIPASVMKQVATAAAAIK